MGESEVFPLKRTVFIYDALVYIFVILASERIKKFSLLLNLFSSQKYCRISFSEDNIDFTSEYEQNKKIKLIHILMPYATGKFASYEKVPVDFETMYWNLG